MRALFVIAAAVFLMATTGLSQWQFPQAEAAALLPLEKRQVQFSEIGGWMNDEHAAAFAVFRKSCKRLLTPDEDRPAPSAEIAAVCQVALLLNEKLSRDDARAFFEANFTPYFVKRPEKGALLTGYYEPEIKGSLVPTAEYTVPLYAKPNDLMLLTSAVSRGELSTELTAARMTSEGPKPYYTRQEIEEGVLRGRGLELAYIADPYEAFVMQVQGSGLIRLQDGKSIRIGFAGKNGHPYTSIGKLLVDRGELTAEGSSMPAVMAWLRADPERARNLMWENKSYPFFEKISGDAPRGAMGLPLTPGRSLAVDPRYHQMGMPIWLSAPDLDDLKGKPMARLMVAQDTGSAIRGPVRGDYFWGSGDDAGKLAGVTKYPCDFYVFVPK